MVNDIYSDFDVQFRMHPITHDIIKKTNDNSIKQSLRLLLQTSFYDRKWQPDVGSDIRDILFDNVGYFELNILEQQIRTLIAKYEPRIQLNNVICEKNDISKITVKIEYKILLTKKEEKFTYTLDRIR